MATVSPIMSGAPLTIIMRLEAIKKGENVTYFTGISLEGCPEAIRKKVDELVQTKRATLTTRRAKLPMNGNGELDRKKGIGTFHYIAQGL